MIAHPPYAHGLSHHCRRPPPQCSQERGPPLSPATCERRRPLHTEPSRRRGRWPVWTGDDRRDGVWSRPGDRGHDTWAAATTQRERREVAEHTQHADSPELLVDMVQTWV